MMSSSGCRAPSRLGDQSELYPDVVVLRHREDHYQDSMPTAADVQLVLEVADTSLRFDLHTKAGVYAAQGLSEYGAEDLRRDCLVVLRGPTTEGYCSVRTLSREDRLRPVSFPDIEIAVSELLG